jgi:hypothetical protein
MGARALLLAALLLQPGLVPAQAQTQAPTAGAPSAAMRSHVWIVGGGSDPQDGSGRIERDVLWLTELMRAATPRVDLKVFLADAAPELRLRLQPAEHREPGLPLARIFGQQAFHADQYRVQRLPEVAGGARADQLALALKRNFSALRAGERSLLVFSAQVDPDLSDRADHALRLWDDTRMPMHELEALAALAPANAPMRFVFAQCHASGFLRLIRPQARDRATLSGHDRCGFVAAPAEPRSGACSPGPRGSAPVGEDSDYLEDFFSALSGRARPGAAAADRDHDGVITLHEAHVHALIEGRHADLPRSTSEAYLERWQPFWLRPLDTRSEHGNDYGRLAAELATRLQLPPQGPALRRAMATRQTQLELRRQDIIDQLGRLDGEIGRLQTALQRSLMQRWPEAAHARTATYLRFLSTESAAVQAHLTARADYAQLVRRQDHQTVLLRDRASVERDLAQLDKVRRLRQLARLKAQFERLASPDARGEYQRLLDCERTPL